jgi:hypothetical protein
MTGTDVGLRLLHLELKRPSPRKEGQTGQMEWIRGRHFIVLSQCGYPGSARAIAGHGKRPAGEDFLEIGSRLIYPDGSTKAFSVSAPVG